jgi:sn-glycerol 3-phosphate transport system ATP-binding protein
MTVAENIGYALKVAGVGKRERVERVAKVARTLELEELLDRKPAALSGGQRQRVAMGRAMIREPSVFLFDEPLSNLDAKLRVQMRIEIRRLHQRLNATSVFVTHDQIEAMTLADRLVVMNEGRIEQVGAPADVYRQPSSHYVAGFIGSPAMNFFDARMVAADRIAFGRNASLSLPGNGTLPPAGAALILGVRPEDLQITPDGGDGSFPFEIEMTEELGAGRLLYGRLADTDCIAATPAAMAPAAGKPVFARIPAGSVHLFSADGGARINGGN